MPTVILNAGMSLLRDASVPVRSDDTLAVVAPMFNEAKGAGRALASLLEQQHLPDEIAVSVNGGSDDTHAVVTATLVAHGYRLRTGSSAERFGARIERWCHPASPLVVLVLLYPRQTAKSESINNLVQSGLVASDRVLVVDGDTVFRPDFIAVLRDNFYRMTFARRGAEVRAVIEDVALQSGTVTSFVPQGGTNAQRFISLARAAEYALAGMLRSGQTRRVGRSAVLGRSRLYTVVGCGFVARRDQFPMPPDTLTEDHDLTLAAQSTRPGVRYVRPREVAARGLRPVIDGVERSFDTLFDRADVLELRRSGEARFVREAQMSTEDPPHLSGYLRQIERWNGGAIQNVLKRVLDRDAWRDTSANVRFALLASVAENVLGLLLLLALPAAIAVHLANPSHGMPLAALSWWFGVDLCVSAVLVFGGSMGAARALGAGRFRSVAIGVGRTLLTLAPFVALKYLNPVSYLAAASKVVPEQLRERRAIRKGGMRSTSGVAWERPIARHVSRRTAGSAASFVVGMSLAAAVAYALVPRMDAVTADAWQLTYRSTVVDMDRYDALPLRAASSRSDRTLAALAALRTRPSLPVRVAWTPDVRSDRSATFAARVGTLEQAIGTAHGGEASVLSLTTGGWEAAVSAGVPAPTGIPALTRTAASTAAAPVAATSVTTTVPAAPPEPSSTLALALGDAGEMLTSGSGSLGPSRYCAPASSGRESSPVHQLDGSARAYVPLTPFDHLMLARLAPIAPLLVGAATTYGVPATLLAQVLVNESYLDPLAVGDTGDKGLSQMTTDALTMLRALSDDPRSPLYNPLLMSQPFTVFDPDFSICAGAAKLAWAIHHVGPQQPAKAYALYINPLNGLVHGEVGERQLPAVDAMLATRPLLLRLGNAYAAYRAAPITVAADDRELLDISAAVASGSIDVATAYRRSYAWVVAHRIDDLDVYESVFARLYDEPLGVAASEVMAPTSMP